MQSNYGAGWEVYHELWQSNNCGSGNGMFSDCLDDILTFHNNNPEHDPIMIYINYTDNWSTIGNHTEQDFDNLLISKFGLNNIYKPSDFLGSDSDMRLMAYKNNWPSFEDLLGKFIIIISDRVASNFYFNALGTNGVCFTMAQTFEPTTALSEINSLSGYVYPDKIIFYNFKLSSWLFGGNQDDWDDAATQMTAPLYASNLGYFTRVWSENTFGGHGNYNEDDFNSVILNKINAIAVRNIDEERDYDDNGIFDLDEVYTPVLNNNHIYSTYPITQYGKNSINVANLIVEPGANYTLISGGPIIGLSTDLLNAPNVTILEYQTLSSTLKYNTLKSQMLTKEEIDEIMKEVKAELNNFQPVEELEKFDFIVYPSPASTILNFVYLNETGEDIVVQIYNISGQKVIQTPYSGQYIGQQKNTINISSLNNGIYIIKLTANNTILTNKFVKQ